MSKINLKQKKQISIEKGLKKFLRHCRIKNLSEYTIDYYQNCYNYFIKFIKEEHDESEDMVVNSINNDLIGDFTLWLVDRYNMRNTTINSRLRGIRAFLYYLMEQGYLNEFKINTRESSDIPKDVYSDEELEKLLEKPNLNEVNFAVYRNWVIVFDCRRYWDIVP